ncbi:MAG: DUF167 family protein [Desulfurococcales archaeon]|nr:DUF167 family protein [Desulfurococcales archaeon]
MRCPDIVRRSISSDKKSVLLQVIVHPNSSKPGIRIDEEGVHIHVDEPPKGGRANQALLKLLKRKYKLKANIKHGHTSRSKVLEITNIDTDTLVQTLCQDVESN